MQGIDNKSIQRAERAWEEEVIEKGEVSYPNIMKVRLPLHYSPQAHT